MVRAFSTEKLGEREDHLREVIAAVGQRFPKAKISVAIDESYRNMSYKIREDPKVLDHALEAVQRIGIEPKRQAIRGGTDGARLSYMGLLRATLEILTVWVEKSA